MGGDATDHGVHQSHAVAGSAREMARPLFPTAAAAAAAEGAETKAALGIFPPLCTGTARIHSAADGKGKFMLDMFKWKE